MKKMLILSMIILLSACAGGPVYNESAMPPLAKGNSRIVIYRPFALNDSANRLTVSIDHHLFAQLPVSSFAYKDMPAGKHVIGPYFKSDENAKDAAERAPLAKYFVTIEAKAGQVAYVEITPHTTFLGISTMPGAVAAAVYDITALPSMCEGLICLRSVESGEAKRELEGMHQP